MQTIFCGKIAHALAWLADYAKKYEMKTLADLQKVQAQELRGAYDTTGVKTKVARSS